MKENFYYNPLKLIFYGIKGLFPPYLIFCEICIVLFLFIGAKYNIVSLNFFDISDYLSISITGLSFTLAIFVAVNNLFDIEELSILATYKDKKNKREGEALFKLLSPFILTSLIFLVTGLSSLLLPAITFHISSTVKNILIILYLSLLSLGLLSLFNLTNSLLNHIYHKAYRKSKNNK